MGKDFGACHMLTKAGRAEMDGSHGLRALKSLFMGLVR